MDYKFTKGLFTLDWHHISLNMGVRRGSEYRTLRFFVPHLSRKPGTLKLICLSVCHKNFNQPHIFWSIKDRALIFCMHNACNKPFLLAPCRDLAFDLLQGQICCQAGDKNYWICLFFLYMKFVATRGHLCITNTSCLLKKNYEELKWTVLVLFEILGCY